ncbi:MAG: hypothetical protein J3Q66DRAFT_408116 [Benniella sp.]|nr:MAG: hypothetical protein J3Q66DRAFT_408116 [Benniella sp.]
MAIIVSTACRLSRDWSTKIRTAKRSMVVSRLECRVLVKLSVHLEKTSYTWDWHPPNLRKLDLAAVFALKLTFQWLQHLPNLQSLRLDISSPVETPCRRHITLEDLSRREPQQASDEGGSGEILIDRYISYRNWND